MKKYLAAVLLALIMLFCGCVASTEPATDVPQKDEYALPETDAPATPDELLSGGSSSPSDVPATPSDTPDASVDTPVSPEDIPDIADSIASMSKPYRIDNNISAAKLSSNKQRLSSMGGLPGFSVYITYNAATDSYSIEETMGDYESIEYMYIWNTGLSVVFRDYVTLHRWMTEIPDYMSVNSSKINAVTPEGYEYTSTIYEHTFSESGILGEENGQIVLNFAFDSPITIYDLYLCCGKID